MRENVLSEGRLEGREARRKTDGEEGGSGRGRRVRCETLSRLAEGAGWSRQDPRGDPPLFLTRFASYPRMRVQRTRVPRSSATRAGLSLFPSPSTTPAPCLRAGHIVGTRDLTCCSRVVMGASDCRLDTNTCWLYDASECVPGRLPGIPANTTLSSLMSTSAFRPFLPTQSA